MTAYHGAVEMDDPMMIRVLIENPFRMSLYDGDCGVRQIFVVEEDEVEIPQLSGIPVGWGIRV